MNLFILDYDKEKCVQFYTDRHNIKIILEVAQLLCSAHHFTGSTLEIPYKPSHKNHPVCLWVRNSLSNYIYAVDLGKELCKEYTYRYNKVHKTQEVIEWCGKNLPDINDIGLTPFALAMPDEYKVEDAVQSYRNYYNGAKRHLFAWRRREIPWWIK